MPSKRCEWLDWHSPGEEREVAGINTFATCVRCGRKLGHDSQGNWYAWDVREPARYDDA